VADGAEDVQGGGFDYVLLVEGEVQGLTKAVRVHELPQDIPRSSRYRAHPRALVGVPVLRDELAVRVQLPGQIVGAFTCPSIDGAARVC